MFNVQIVKLKLKTYTVYFSAHIKRNSSAILWCTSLTIYKLQYKQEYNSNCSPSTRCIFAFIVITVSYGDTVTSNVVPVRVSIYNAITSSSWYLYEGRQSWKDIINTPAKYAWTASVQVKIKSLIS